MINFRQIVRRHFDVFKYLFFGVCTTLVNIFFYTIFTKVFYLNTVSATSASWFLAVLFAYFTNRKWVFSSQAKTKTAILKEISSFFLCRLVTGLLDVVIMVVFVDYLRLPDLPMKIISNILVIITNYIASKLFIFKQINSRKIAKK